MSNKQFHSSAKKAKNLGSAHAGGHHWWHQRFTAICLVLLTTWFFCFIARLMINGGHIISLLSEPYNLVGMVLFTVISFYHAALGMRVIIEDYVSNICWRYKLIILVQIISLGSVVTMLTALMYFIGNNI